MKETRFKDTEVGRIPVDWEVVRFSDIAEAYSGLTYSPNNVNSYGTLVLRSSNIKRGQLIYDDNVYVDMHIPQRAVCHEGDILICVRNGSKSLIGKSAIISKAADGVAFGAFMSILRAKEVDNKLLLYLWQSEYTQKQVQESLGATINQITNGDFNRFLTILPPPQEQHRIARTLTNIDELIASLDKLIAKKKDIKQGAMQQLLTGKVRLKGFTDKWVEKKLGDFLDSIKSGISALQSEIRISGFKVFGGNGWTGENYLKYNVEKSAIIVGRVGALCGNVHIVNEKVWVTDNALILTLLNGHDNLFFFYLLLFQKLNELRTGNAQPLITGGMLKSLRICVPSSLPEQRAIATILTDMDNELAALEAKRSKYAMIKDGMMQQLLTGKIRLTD